MCTAISFMTRDHYFGRNLDLEYTYEESVTVTPRKYPFNFRRMPKMTSHYALIGVAYIRRDYPLYYDATNEHGLSIAGLNFPGNAKYHAYQEGKNNIAPFELIPWILGQCKSVAEAESFLENLNLLDEAFSTELPLTPLHWIISDSQRSLVLEPATEGIKIFENPVKVLTNNPPFDYHLHNLQNYLNLTAQEPVNRFCKNIPLKPYSRGMGAIGLPGDLSSASRFVRAAFVLHNSRCESDEDSSISQFFHILGAVTQQEGCAQVGSNYEKTVYSSCCNTRKGIYYYKTYSNSQITAVDMHKEDLEGSALSAYPLRHKQNIFWEK